MLKTYRSFPRNIYLLFFLQIIGGCAVTVLTLVGGFIGAVIAPTPTLSTLPAGILVAGIASGTIPAALLMKKIGRKKGFLIASSLAIIASLGAAFAVAHHNFLLFCMSAFFIGFYSAFVQQYRFAATESVSKSLASKAVGFVLFAGILSGIIGPEIVVRNKDLFHLPEFSGPFVFLAILMGVSTLLLMLLKDTHIYDEQKHLKERPLKNIIVQPHFFIAVLAASTAFGVMSLITGAVPVHLHTTEHYNLGSIVFLTQSHVIAMYLPSLFTGALIQRFGVYRMLLAGLFCFCVAVTFGVHAHEAASYWASMVLIGIGWNFLYISSTLLLSQSHSHLERFKAQGLNDFMVMIIQMIGSFLAGSILFSSGWINLNLLTLPLIFITAVIFCLNRKRVVRT